MQLTLLLLHEYSKFLKKTNKKKQDCIDHAKTKLQNETKMLKKRKNNKNSWQLTQNCLNKNIFGNKSYMKQQNGCKMGLNYDSIKSLQKTLKRDYTPEFSRTKEELT